MYVRAAMTLTVLAWGFAAVLPAAAQTAPAAASRPATTAPAATGPAEKKAEDLSPAGDVAIAKALASSVVCVEYTVQYDKGEAPRWGGGYGSIGPQRSLEEERPMEVAGFVLSPTRIVTSDIMMHPRFKKKMAVRFGEQLVDAKIGAVATRHGAMFLDLAEPLKGVKPLVFDAKAKPPYKIVAYTKRQAQWVLAVRNDSMSVDVTETGRELRDMASNCLITDKKGTPVGISMNSSAPADGSWKGSPLKWDALSTKDMEAMRQQCEQVAGRTVMRVALSFRSPKKRAGEQFSGFGQEVKTEHNALGVLVDSKTVLVLLSLNAKVTARLERIRVHPPTGEPVAARFRYSLKDYGCILAELSKPLPGGAPLSKANIRDFHRQALPVAEIRLQGEKVVPYFMHTRIDSYGLGWSRKVFPSLATDTDIAYLFTPRGALVALPVIRRPKPGTERRWSGGSRFTPVAHLREILADPAKHADPSNVPLTEAEENRIAWLGVVMQPLNPELARINKVSHLTQDGRTGVLVSYVYPKGPAAAMGIKVGDVLLRLHVKDRPKPIDIRTSEYAFSRQPFPWNRLDGLPEQYYDQIPSPWSPVENVFTRALTDIGFGKDVEMEFFSNDKVQRKTFKIVASPTHYLSAPRHKSKVLGLTVADMTYEARRYFHKTQDDPGVICSKIEPGSKASVSGLKPYELITHVNNAPVRNVKDFERLIAGQDELRLEVKRMTRGRVVKIKMDVTTQPATQPATRPATSGPSR